MPETTLTIGDLTVHRIGFGTVQVTGPGMWGPPEDPDATRALVRRAVELGVTFIDTADSYGPDTAELILAEALHPYPEGLVIATKGGCGRDGPDFEDYAPWPRRAAPDQLRTACEGSLKRLRVDCIDLYQLHAPDPAVPIEESVGALKELRDEGKIRHVGVSNVTLAELERARSVVEIVAVQNRFSVAERDGEDVLEVCERDGLALIPWFPLAGGRLGALEAALVTVAERHGASRMQVALAWLLARSPVLLPIPGTTKPAHLEQNMAAAELELSADDLALLES